MTNTLFILLCTFANTFGILDVWLILMLFLKCDMNLNRRNLSIGAGIFAVLNIIVYSLIDAESLWITFFIFVYAILSACILSKHRRWWTVLMTVPAILIYTYGGIMFDLVEKMLGLDKFQFYYKQTITLSICLSDFLLCIILLFLWKYSREKAFSTTLSKVEGIAIVFLAFMMPEVNLIFEEWADTRLYTILWTAFLLTINAALIYAIAHRKMAAYYQRLSANYRNQFSQEYDKAKNYFEVLSQQTIPCRQNFVTGNEVVDTILSAKADVLERERIRLVFEGKLEIPASMQDVDCCILFSNLLDNAIEANQALEGERYIGITARTANQIHGIGLKNVIAIIDKYHGECRIASDELKFSVQILLPM